MNAPITIKITLTDNNLGNWTTPDGTVVATGVTNQTTLPADYAEIAGKLAPQLVAYYRDVWGASKLQLDCYDPDWSKIAPFSDDGLVCSILRHEDGQIEIEG